MDRRPLWMKAPRPGREPRVVRSPATRNRVADQAERPVVPGEAQSDLQQRVVACRAIAMPATTA